MGWTFKVSCAVCKPKVIFGSNCSLKCARDQLNRHKREKHKQGGAKARQRRLQLQTARNKWGKAAQVRKRLSRCAIAGLNTHTVCRVLCPRRRDVNFTTCKHALMNFGLESIERDCGWDFVAGARLPKWVPQHMPTRLRGQTVCSLPSFKWEHLWFEHDFLPKIIKRLQETPTLQTVILFEDDAAPRKTATIEGLFQTIAQESPSAVWIGYFMKGGKPAWGSQCLSITLPSAKGLLQYSKNLRASEDSSSDKCYKHYRALDTFLKQLLGSDQNCMQSGQPILAAAGQSFFTQSKHSFRGRN